MSIKDTLTPEDLEKHAHSVRALPKPRYTRIDFFCINVGAALGEREPRWGWKVLKYIEGWTAHTPPHQVEFDPPIKSADGQQHVFDIDKAIAALEPRGWTVHRWQFAGMPGARAWLGPPMPVRNRDQIVRFRKLLTRQLDLSHGNTTTSTQVDLAFDY